MVPARCRHVLQCGGDVGMVLVGEGRGAGGTATHSPETATGGVSDSAWRPSAPGPTIIWHRCLPEPASQMDRRPFV